MGDDAAASRAQREAVSRGRAVVVQVEGVCDPVWVDEPSYSHQKILASDDYLLHNTI